MKFVDMAQYGNTLGGAVKCHHVFLAWLISAWVAGGQENGAYRETRLGESHLFIQHLDRCYDSFRYQCQAVNPGIRLALPTRAECEGDAMRLDASLNGMRLESPATIQQFLVSRQNQTPLKYKPSSATLNC